MSENPPEKRVRMTNETPDSATLPWRKALWNIVSEFTNGNFLRLDEGVEHFHTYMSHLKSISDTLLAEQGVARGKWEQNIRNLMTQSTSNVLVPISFMMCTPSSQDSINEAWFIHAFGRYCNLRTVKQRFSDLLASNAELRREMTFRLQKNYPLAVQKLWDNYLSVMRDCNKRLDIVVDDWISLLEQELTSARSIKEKARGFFTLYARYDNFVAPKGPDEDDALDTWMSMSPVDRKVYQDEFSNFWTERRESLKASRDSAFFTEDHNVNELNNWSDKRAREYTSRLIIDVEANKDSFRARREDESGSGVAQAIATARRLSAGNNE